MGLGSIWSTVKQKFSAGVAATIAVAGTAVLVFVNMPGHPAQYGLYNPTTGDTLWASDSANLDWKYDSLVAIGHITVVPGDYVYAYSKRGDIISTDAKQSLLNGYIIEVIDPADEGWRPSIAAEQRELKRALTPAEMEDMLFPSSGKMRKAYSVIRAKRGSTLAAKLKASTVPTDTSVTAKKYRPKSGFVDYAALEKAMNVQGLKDKANSPDVMEILDGDKIPANVIQLSGVDTAAVIKDAKEKTPEAAHDFNVISKGEYTIGSGGAYATVTAFMADITTMDSALTGVVISSHTITAVATSTATATGQIFTLRNHANGAHGGSFTKGYIISANLNDQAILCRFNGGTIIIKDLSITRTITTPASAKYAINVSYTTNRGLVQVSNCLTNSNGLTKCCGIVIDGRYGSKVYNCSVVFSNTVGIGFIATSDSGMTMENCTVISTESVGNYAFYIGGKAQIVRNCIGMGSATNFATTALATGYNNASTDTTCSNASWATGTGNRVSIVAATEFVSTDPTSTSCGRLTNGGVLWNGGTTPTYAGATDLAGRARPGRGGGYAIGAFEYHYLAAPGLVGIAPNYARGDSTRPLPDTTGDQIVFWFTGDTAKTGKWLNLINNDTGVGDVGVTLEAGVVGRAARFSGTDSIVWADQNLYDISGQATIMSWVKQVAATSNGWVIGKSTYTTSNTGYSLFMNQGAKTLTTYGCNPASSSSVISTFDDVWLRLSVVFSDSVRYYANNIAYGSAALGGPAIGTEKLQLGTTQGRNSTSSALNGWIDLTIIADTAISQIKRNTYYISGRELPGLKDTTTTGLFYTDTAGRQVDTVWFAVGDTTTWRKFKVVAGNVYNVSPYLTSGATNTIYCRASNDVGVSGVTAYQVYASLYTLDTLYRDTSISHNVYLDPKRRHRAWGDTMQIDSILGADTVRNWKRAFRDSLFWDTIKVRRTGSMGTGIGTAQ